MKENAAVVDSLVVEAQGGREFGKAHPRSPYSPAETIPIRSRQEDPTGGGGGQGLQGWGGPWQRPLI